MRNLNKSNLSAVANRPIKGIFVILLFCLPMWSCLNREEKACHPVVCYFDRNGDSLKSIAARFLLENMNSHIQTDIHYDTFLIRNIEDAFRQNKSRQGDLSRQHNFELFLEYCVPHRVFVEKPEAWRDSVKRLLPEFGSTTSKLSNLQLSRRINQRLRAVVKFNNNRSDAADRTWSEIMSAPEGDCWLLAKAAIFSHRALGIPVSIDYTPAWANMNGSHAWNCLIAPDSTNVPFMGCESLPGDYETFAFFGTTKKTPKVFRMTYSVQKHSLAYINHGERKIPITLNDDRFIDVTREYIPTSDIDVHLRDSTNFQASYAYLCVFNNGAWTPIDWCRKAGDMTFHDLGRDIIYLPSIYRNGLIIPIGPPIWLKNNGTTETLKTDYTHRVALRIQNTKSLELDILDVLANDLPWPTLAARIDMLKENQGRATPGNGDQYALYYWDDTWKLFESRYTSSSGLTFSGVPTNTLYRLIRTGSSGHKERIFMYFEGQQYWY